MSWKISGNYYISQPASKTVDILPHGTYYVRYSQSRYYLEQVKDFELPKKIYGNTDIISRWLTSYTANECNTGIILTGIKGSGKTLLSKKCAIDSGLPIIIIDRPYGDSDFISFITSPEIGDVCIFIDEFEKVFSERNSVNPLLTLLDGAFNTHHLFILTCNEMHTNSYLTNRPSRIRYRSHFESLPEEVINEVIEDLLKRKEYSDSIKTVLRSIGVVTFDLLITLIREVDLFNEPAEQLVQYLNITAEPISVDIYEVWKGKSHLVCYNKVLSSRTDTLMFARNFNAIKDPEYCDEDDVDLEDGFTGLPSYVYLPWSEIRQIDNDHWEYRGELGKFNLERVKYKRLIV